MKQIAVLALLLPGCGGGRTASTSTGAPSALFTISRTFGPAPLYVETTGSTSGSWNFGDGTVAIGSTAAHSYSLPGTYTVTFTVEGASSSIAVTVTAAAPPLAPLQPASGPGGVDYAHGTVKQTLYGSGATAYTLFEPQDPVPASAPVVVFLHGWDAINTAVYGDWLNHLARKGRIVIAPAYQVPGSTLAGACTGNAMIALQAAFAELATGAHVPMQPGNVLVAGHSFGGVITANLGVLAGANGLPLPKALMCVHPGAVEPVWTLVTEDFSLIPAGTLLLTVAGDVDTIAPPAQAFEIFTEATSVAAADKDYILVHGDTHGDPDLIAQHGACTSPLINALDWYGYWKWLDALCDATFLGTNRSVALGGGAPGQRFMGLWSDGVAVTPADVTD